MALLCTICLSYTTCAVLCNPVVTTCTVLHGLYTAQGVIVIVRGNRKSGKCARTSHRVIVLSRADSELSLLSVEIGNPKNAHGRRTELSFLAVRIRKMAIYPAPGK